MKKTINVEPIVTAFDGVVTAYGALKKAVQDAFKGCKTLEQYTQRRAAVFSAIEASVTDKKKVAAIKAKVNQTLSGNRSSRIMPEGMHFPKTQKGGRTARPAAKATGKEVKATGKAVEQTLALHDMASVMAAIAAISEKASKADCVAMRDRIVNQFASIISSKK